MRGKADQRQGREPPGRITPAYAGKSSLALCVHHFHKDHPRICGEKSLPPRPMRAQRGSPPRMRGKVTATPANAGATGITPAYAGKSYSILSTRKKARDHPRVCGEKCRKCAPLISIQGSPPRMRGKGVKRCLVWAIPRITPAYAGKRDGVERVRNCAEDHPRVCGEKNRRRAGMVCDMGSPPRMRGKELYQRTTLFLFGITPAYAGKRFAHGVSVGAHGDHPRVCGEKHPDLAERITITRITPAYAGKRMPKATGLMLRSDHPRVCGEKGVLPITRSKFSGSPPRMRGKVAVLHRHLRLHRITPAYAGKRTAYRIGQAFTEDHPRVCGEKG